MSRRVVILCPLAVERKAAANVAGGRAEIVQSGPGASNVRAAIQELDLVEESDAPLLILFGVAGGLAPSCPDSAPINRVLDLATGDAFESALSRGGGVTLIGVDALITSPASKRDLHERTGAAMVDMESHVFARACAEKNIPWAVVRGVSDGPDDALPPESLRWIDTRGDLRPMRLLLDLARRPSLLPSLLRLGNRSRRALAFASAELAALLDTHAGTINRS